MNSTVWEDYIFIFLLYLVTPKYKYRNDNII